MIIPVKGREGSFHPTYYAVIKKVSNRMSSFVTVTSQRYWVCYAAKTPKSLTSAI